MGVMSRLATKRTLMGGKANGFATVVLETNRLMAAIDDKRRRVLFQTGGYARKTMYRMLNKNPPKRAKTHAGKVRPPYTHRTKNGHAGALARLVGFQVFEKEGSLVAGPSIANFRSKTVPIAAKTVPELLDKGGPAMLDQKPANYRAFPFVAPAFEKAYEKFADRIAKLPLTARR